MNNYLTLFRKKSFLVIFSFAVAIVGLVKGYFLPTSLFYSNMTLSLFLTDFGWKCESAQLVAIVFFYFAFTSTLLILTGLPLTIKTLFADSNKFKASIRYCSFLLCIPAAFEISCTYSLVWESIFSWTPLALSGVLLLLLPLCLHSSSEKVKQIHMTLVKIYAFLIFVLYTVALLLWPMARKGEML